MGAEEETSAGEGTTTEEVEENDSEESEETQPIMIGLPPETEQENNKVSESELKVTEEDIVEAESNTITLDETTEITEDLEDNSEPVLNDVVAEALD